MNNNILTEEKKNKIPIILSIIGVIMIACGLVIYFKTPKEEEAKPVPIEYNTLENGLGKIDNNGMEISDFSVEKVEEYNIWLLHITLKNTLDSPIDTNGIYKLTYYGDNNEIINVATDRFMFTIEPNNELILGIGLDFDGSLLRNFSMEKIED